MFSQLALGTIVMVITIVIQAGFIGFSSYMLQKCGQWFVSPPTIAKLVLTLIVLVLWLVLGLTVSAWLWAFVFIAVDALTSLEEALYFSVVTFTTLGYGDITLSPQWRILASLTAVNGLIVVGLNTAYLVEAISRIRNAQEQV